MGNLENNIKDFFNQNEMKRVDGAPVKIAKNDLSDAREVESV